MGALKKIGNGITIANEKINDAASWLMYPLVIVVMYEVVKRYLFNNPTNWVYDMTWMLCGTYVFLGFAHGWHTGIHVKADIIYNMLGAVGKFVFDMVSYVLFFFPTMTLLCWSCWQYFWKSFVQKDTSIGTIWGPILWPMKLILAISMTMLALQGIVEFARRIGAFIDSRKAGEEVAK